MEILLFFPSFFMSDKSGCMGCSVIGYVVAAIYAVITLVTVYALYNTHFLPDGGFIAGAPEGSLALLTFIFAFHMFIKALKKCCPCGPGSCATSCCK